MICKLRESKKAQSIGSEMLCIGSTVCNVQWMGENRLFFYRTTNETFIPPPSMLSLNPPRPIILGTASLLCSCLILKSSKWHPFIRIKKIFFKDFCLSNYYVTNDYFWWCWYFLNIPFWCTLVLSVRIREGGETAW